jgi:hypothetical protein
MPKFKEIDILDRIIKDEQKELKRHKSLGSLQSLAVTGAIKYMIKSLEIWRDLIKKDN